MRQPFRARHHLTPCLALVDRDELAFRSRRHPPGRGHSRANMRRLSQEEFVLSHSQNFRYRVLIGFNALLALALKAVFSSRRFLARELDLLFQFVGAEAFETVDERRGPLLQSFESAGSGPAGGSASRNPSSASWTTRTCAGAPRWRVRLRGMQRRPSPFHRSVSGRSPIPRPRNQELASPPTSTV